MRATGIVMWAMTTLSLGKAADPFHPGPANDVWMWNDVENATCLNGKSTGVYVKYGNSSNVGIYLNGGGACFNLATCETCAKSNKPSPPGVSGIFSSTDSRNPFKDFNWIAVPYCTGDVHIGDMVAKVGLETRTFRGAGNLRLIAERAKATWPSVSTLLVTGESAGGFGAFSGYDIIRSYWDEEGTRGIMLDDSGPVLDDDALAPCLQSEWRSIWNLNESLPDGCPCIGNSGNLVSAWKFGMQKWGAQGDSFGLISSLEDAVISGFFAYGENDCKRVIPIGYNKLADGLSRLSKSGVPIYMISGSEHTHTGDKNEFYTRNVSGVALYEWVTDLANPNVPDPPSVSPSQRKG